MNLQSFDLASDTSFIDRCQPRSAYSRLAMVYVWVLDISDRLQHGHRLRLTKVVSQWNKAQKLSGNGYERGIRREG